MARAVQLDVWTPEQGADFFAERLSGSAREELLALATGLEGLPLALAQAAADLDVTGISMAEYRRLFATIDIRAAISSTAAASGRARPGHQVPLPRDTRRLR